MNIWSSLALIILSLICGMIGVAVAECKGRPKSEGFALGCLLIVIGIILESVLPKRRAATGR
jgi:hypothetical protein